MNDSLVHGRGHEEITHLLRKMIMITALDVWMLTDRIKHPGTGNQSLYNTLMGYARSGWQVHVLTTSRTCEGMPSIHDDVFIHRSPIRLYDYAAWSRRFLRTLFRSERKKKNLICSPDGAQPTSPPAGLHPYAMLFRTVMGRRALQLARGIGDVDLIYGYEIHGALAAKAASSRLRLPLVTRFQGTEMCRFLGQPDAMRLWKTDLKALRIEADLVIMTDDGTQGDEVLAELEVPQERVRFWMNGVVKGDVYRPHVDRDRIRVRLGLQKGEAMVLHAGRMFHWKRIDRHLRVLQRTREQASCFRAVFIGDGPEFAAMKQLSHELGQDEYVHFLGAMPHAEVMTFLNACDIYISFYDLSNLSNSLIEACVCGKCIVTTNVGGTDHLLTDGVNAVVVKSQHDEVEIASGLARVLQNPVERNRLASGAFLRGEQLETWDKRMEREIGEVETLLARRQR